MLETRNALFRHSESLVKHSSRQNPNNLPSNCNKIRPIIKCRQFLSIYMNIVTEKMRQPPSFMPIHSMIVDASIHQVNIRVQDLTYGWMLTLVKMCHMTWLSFCQIYPFLLDRRFGLNDITLSIRCDDSFLQAGTKITH
jgi:hypothetical protein